jgi:KaiC/GvpD/RAD55 family RecA-like ATPase
VSESARETDSPPVVERFPHEEITDSVLIYGPAMSGQRRLGVELLARGDETGQQIYVTTTERAWRARNVLGSVTANSDGTVIVDCLTTEAESDRTIPIGSPANLFEIADALATLYSDLDRSEQVGSRVLIDNLATMLLHTNIERLTRFLHPVIRHVEEHGGIVIATLDTDGVSAAERQTILGLFDQHIAVRTTERHGHEYSVDDAKTWHQFEPPREEQ